MNDELSLSIVIPVYNEEGHLKRCLDAIAAQTILPDEVVVVDNNSTDLTVKIARKYPFVKVLNEERQGVLFATRTGFDAVSTQIIGRIDADTVLTPTWVAQVKTYLLEHPDTDAITGNCYFYDFPFRRSFRVLHHGFYYSLQKLISGTEILWGSNMAMRRTAWHEVRSALTTREDIHEDIDLSLHMQDHGLIIERWPKLAVDVSLRRGNFSPEGLIKYLIPWPKTYWLNGRHLQALAISVTLGLIWLFILPLSLLVWGTRQLKSFTHLFA